MLINEFGNITVIGVGVLGFFMLFALQLMCCFGFKSIALRLVPVYMVALSLVLAFVTYIGLMGTSSAGAISANGIVGALIAFVAAISALGIVAGWLVWLLVRKK